MVKSLFVYRTTTKKINMLIMCNVKTEYKNGDAEKTTLAFLCHLKIKVYLFFDT